MQASCKLVNSGTVYCHYKVDGRYQQPMLIVLHITYDLTSWQSLDPITHCQTNASMTRVAPCIIDNHRSEANRLSPWQNINVKMDAKEWRNKTQYENKYLVNRNWMQCQSSQRHPCTVFIYTQLPRLWDDVLCYWSTTFMSMQKLIQASHVCSRRCLSYLIIYWHPMLWQAVSNWNDLLPTLQ